MNPDQKQEIKQIITEKLNTLEKTIKTFEGLSKPVSPDNAIGRLTRMEAINSRSINEASLAKSQQTRKALKKAIDAIDGPDFGFCLHCDEPIAHKRLLIMPEALLCVGCAEKLSKGQS